MIFLMIGGVFAFLGSLLWWRQSAEASIPPETLPEGVRMNPPSRLVGTFLPTWEDETIFTIAQSRGVDARLLAAIRKAEMGGPGREFGILSIPAPTYDMQARIAATTILNNIGRYETATGISAYNGTRLSNAFIAYLGGKYAPVGAENDPTGLNVNWINNVASYYGRIEYA